MIIAVTMRCSEPTCREACERTDLWRHIADGSIACDEPEKFEVTPDRAAWSGRLWRIEDARQAMRSDAMRTAGAIVAMQPRGHCGDCDAGLRLSIAGAIEQAWEAGFHSAQDEYQRPHPPVTRFALSHV